MSSPMPLREEKFVRSELESCTFLKVRGKGELKGVLGPEVSDAKLCASIV